MMGGRIAREGRFLRDNSGLEENELLPEVYEDDGDERPDRNLYERWKIY